MIIMISYRRADSAPITGRIYDRLSVRFGPDHVFMDIDSIPMGIDYRSHIQDSMKKCDVLLTVIGPRWLGAGDVGARQIDDPSDWVRLEVAHALERNIRVIPLLVEDGHMPTIEELPEDLKILRFRQALRVDSGIDFHHHIDRLCAAIEAIGRGPSQPVREGARADSPTSTTIDPSENAGAEAAKLAEVRCKTAESDEEKRKAAAAPPAVRFFRWLVGLAQEKRNAEQIDPSENAGAGAAELSEAPHKTDKLGWTGVALAVAIGLALLLGQCH